VPRELLIHLILEQLPRFRTRLYIHDEHALAELQAGGLLECMPGDYAWSLCFDAPFVSRLCLEGILPICCELELGNGVSPGLYILLPKLHVQRCVLLPGKLHISKKVRKRAARYRLTVCQAFDEVLQQCIHQHGVAWLYPPMQRLLKAMAAPASLEGLETCRSPRFVSFELWTRPEMGDTIPLGEGGGDKSRGGGPSNGSCDGGSRGGSGCGSGGGGSARGDASGSGSSADDSRRDHGSEGGGGSGGGSPRGCGSRCTNGPSAGCAIVCGNECPSDGECGATPAALAASHAAIAPNGGDCGVNPANVNRARAGHPQLVAGDLGCMVGSVYTSFSGFHFGDGTGSIQLALTGRLLERAGFGMRDLGQEHTYKAALGASTLPRREFLAKFRQLTSLPNRLREVVGDSGDATEASALR
jgi:Leu/Phe-tRNA-protein transferase